MIIEYIKSKTNTNLWSICKNYDFSDEPQQESNFSIGEMSIMRDNTNRISGGPIVAYFTYEDDADEYIKFKNKQLGINE